MLLTQEQAEQRVNSPRNLANRFRGPQPQIVEIRNKGRKTSVPNLPPNIKDDIAVRARLGEKQKPLAEEYGTTQARVSQIERGRAKSLNESAIADRIDAGKELAVTKLLQSLNLITPEKLKKENVQSLANVASQMSKIIERTTPQQQQPGNGVQIVIYAPELKKETSFKVVDV